MTLGTGSMTQENRDIIVVRADRQPKPVTISELLKRKRVQPVQSQVTPGSSLSSGTGRVLTATPQSIVTEQEENNRESAPQEEVLNYNVPMAPLMWDLVQKLKSKKELDLFLTGENCWSVRTSCTLKSGHKRLYRCNKVTLEGPQCNAELCVLHQIIIDDYQLTMTDEPDTETDLPGTEIVAGPSDQENTNEETIEEEIMAVNTGARPNAIAPQSNEQDPVVGEIDELGTHIYKVYRLNRMHNHEELENQTATKVKPHVRQLIIDLSKDFKPKTIIYKLRDREDIAEEDQPSQRQVRAVIEEFKSELYGKDPLTMRQLTEFVNANMKVPTEQDRAFILTFERSPSTEPEKYFRFFVTTQRLLRMAIIAKNIHADGTHKVTVEKLPLLVVGSTDITKRFHLIGLVISTRETALDYEFAFKSVLFGVHKITGKEVEPTFLMADADPAIHNGFRNAGFDPNITIMMCYFHVIFNVDTKYKFADKQNKQLLVEDLRTIHKSGDYRTFRIGCNVFVKKWIDKERDVVKKLEKSFFKKNYNWFIGSGFRVPKTNNALERFNGTTKLFQTQYQQKPLKQFMHLILNVVAQRSKEYVMDKKPFQSELEISNELMDKGFAYEPEFVYHENENKETEFFIYRSGIDKQITDKDVEEFQAAVYDSFDEFATNAFNIYKLVFPADSNQWKYATCNCPAFDTVYMCKHIIGIAYKIGATVPPEKNYDDEAIFSSKKGRPKRASGALTMD